MNEYGANINKENREWEEFKRELEEDPEYRANVQLYKVKGADTILKNRKRLNADELPEPNIEELVDDMVNMSINAEKKNNDANNTNKEVKMNASEVEMDMDG